VAQKQVSSYTAMTAITAPINVKKSAVLTEK
jgi:hypothetical protein